MKYVMGVLLISLVSCGKHTENKYIENPFDNSENEARLKELDQRVSVLESSITNIISEMEKNSLELQLSTIQEQILTLTTTNTTLQTIVNDLQMKQAELETGVRVVVMIDPCANITNKGYKQNLFKLGNGKLVSYFNEDGKNLLKVLSNGEYETTDSRKCTFTVTEN